MSELQNNIDECNRLRALNVQLLKDISEISTENAKLREDAERLDWLEKNPRHAQIIVSGVAMDCVFYGISCHELVKLRDAIDAAKGKT